LQDAVVKVIITGSIDTFARELELAKDEAWEVYLQIKDLLVDAEILGILLNVNHEMNLLSMQTKNEAAMIKNSFAEQLKRESDQLQKISISV
jgi:hypothetical protein